MFSVLMKCQAARVSQRVGGGGQQVRVNSCTSMDPLSQHCHIIKGYTGDHDHMQPRTTDVLHSPLLMHRPGMHDKSHSTRYTSETSTDAPTCWQYWITACLVGTPLYTSHCTI